MDYMIISMRVTFCMSMKDMGDLSLPTHDLFWANLKVQLRLSPLRSLDLLRWRWAAKVGLLSLRVVCQQQCNGHCLCDCPSTAAETAIAQCTSRWAMARGHRLNTSIVLAAVHSLSGLFWVVSAVEPSFFRPISPHP